MNGMSKHFFVYFVAEFVYSAVRIDVKCHFFSLPWGCISRFLCKFALMQKIWIITLMALAVLTGCGKKADKNTNGNRPAAANLPVDTALQSRLKAFTAKPRVAGNLGICVYDLTAEKPVYGYNEKKALPSASCLKLLTGVAGLHLLGPDYKFASSIFTKGEVKDGVLQGDVIFRGWLDPQLQEPDLAMFAKALKRKGIRKVGGKVRVNLVSNEPVKSEAHWYPWDLTFSKYGLLFKGGPRVMRALKAALRAQGIQVADNQMVYGGVPSGAHCLFRYYRTIGPVIKRMWKNSSNTQATALLYTIGNKYQPKEDPTKAGVAYLYKFLREDLGMKDSTLVIHDGCGLCTHNHLSPEALCEVLKYGYRDGGIRPYLKRYLSISGVDGTLAQGLPDAALRGKIYGKTGTLSHPYGISSVSGFAKGEDGHLLAFSIMASEMSVLDAHVLQRKFCKTLVMGGR